MVNLRYNQILFFLLFSFIICSCGGNSPKNESGKSDQEFNLPLAIGFVNDFDSILSPSQQDSLRDLIIDFKIKSSNEIAIATIDNMGSYDSLKHFAVDLANFWGIGVKDKDNGALILVCQQIHEVFIAIGTFTETIISNAEIKTIIDDSIIPEFNDGEFYLGIKKGVEQLIIEWEK